ncbi:MAG: hypothetical protein ACHREM_00055 [Polyangiales bacterium]
MPTTQHHKRTPRDSNQPWRSLPIIVWHVETTGPDPLVDRIVEIGAVFFANQTQFESGDGDSGFLMLVDPERKIPDNVLTTPSVGHAIELALEWFREIDQDNLPTILHAAHDSAFSLAMFRNEWLRASHPDAPARMPAMINSSAAWIDGSVWAHEVIGASLMGKFDAATVAAELDVEPIDGVSRALSSAKLAGQILSRLPERPAAPRVLRNGTVGNLLRWQAHHDAAQALGRADRLIVTGTVHPL